MKRVYYTSIEEDRASAIAKAQRVLSETYGETDREKVRIVSVREGTEEGSDGSFRHPDTHRVLPPGTRAWIIEAMVPGEIRGYRTDNDGPLPQGVTPPGQGGPKQ